MPTEGKMKIMPTEGKMRAVSGAETGRKLLHVLMCFTGANPTWSVADIASKLDLTTSTAYRYVGLLKEEGLLEVAPDSTYRVTVRALSLAEAYTANGATLMELALPVMTRLCDEVGETILLARRIGEFAFCIDRVESRQSVRLQFERGQAMALHAGSMPRLLLSYMPARERTRYLEKARPLVAPERLPLLTEEALAENAKSGFVESMEEIDAQIWGCAAVVDRSTSNSLVIGTAGPLYRLDEAARERIKEQVRAAAGKLTALLEGKSLGR